MTELICKRLNTLLLQSIPKQWIFLNSRDNVLSGKGARFSVGLSRLASPATYPWVSLCVYL